MIKIFLSIILLLPIITFASNNPINNFIIGFWPEYDHPGVLVSIQIESDSTQLPYNFNLIVPNTTRMAIESYVEENEQISNQVEVINVNNQSLLPMNINRKNYYAQFYFNPFKESAERKIEYNIQADIDILKYYVVIQKHLGGTEFTTNLADVESITDEFGLTYYRSKHSILHSGESHTIKISYNNPDNLTSMSILNEMVSNMKQNQNENENEIEIENNYINNKMYVLSVSTIMTILILAVSLAHNNNLLITPGKIQCKRCGNTINLSSKYCKECGDKIVS
jgi:hypothetical protein